YFDDIINFCDGFGLSDGLVHIKFVLKYVPFELADLWSHLVESSNGDWKCFTLEVVQLYPELEESCRNQFFGLRDALAGLDAISVSSLGKYFHSFSHYSLSLEKQKKSSSHLPVTFFYGFLPEFRHELFKHHDSPDQGLTVSSIIASAKQVLSHLEIASGRAARLTTCTCSHLAHQAVIHPIIYTYFAFSVDFQGIFMQAAICTAHI
ncbi:hypothetical protein M404DRAFT_161928, partial [Pisolithus tinctorius Marx 270]